MSAFLGFDIYIAIGLIAIALIIIFINQMGVLPKKSLPFVAGGLLGIFGYFMFRRSRQKGLKKEIKRREEALKVEEKRLDTMKKEMQVSEQELNEVQAELDNQRAAAKKALLLNEAKTKAEKERIDKLSTKDTFDEFDAVFGG